MSTAHTHTPLTHTHTHPQPSAADSTATIIHVVKVKLETHIKEKRGIKLEGGIKREQETVRVGGNSLLLLTFPGLCSVLRVTAAAE